MATPLSGPLTESDLQALLRDGDLAGSWTLRDKHLRSPAFFDIGNHPEIIFTAESATPAGRGVRFAGQLTVAGRARPATVDATVSRAGDELTVAGQLQVDRRDFGLTWNFIGIAGNHSTIDVHAVFARAS